MLTLVLIVAAALRGAWLLGIPIDPTSDGKAYDAFAWNLASVGVYGWTPDEPSSHWPPGTSFLYSLVYRAFGHSYLAIGVLNLVLGVILVLLTMLLADRWFNRRVALGAGLWVALWPSWILYTTVLASELPFVVLVLLAVLVDEGSGSRMGSRAALVGVLVSAAAYVRMEGMLLPLILGASRWRRGSSMGSAAWSATLTAIVAIALISPWCYRNGLLEDRAVFVTTSAGLNLWMGNNPETEGESVRAPSYPGLTRVERDRRLGALAIDYIAEKPVRFVGRSIVKAVRLHERETIAFRWNERALERLVTPGWRVALKIASQAYWLIVLGTAVVGGAWLLLREGWGMLLHPVFSIWAFITALHSVTMALQDRFHFPSTPFIAMLAAYLVISWGKGIENGDARRRVAMT